MSVRHIKFELEARLTGSKDGFFSKPSGKLERKSYKYSGERMKISLCNPKVPDGSVASVICDRIELAAITIRDGTGRFDKESNDLSEFPPFVPRCGVRS